MKITFMTKDRKKVITLPIVNDDIKWGKSMNHQTVETVNNGEILILGRRKLIEVSIDSFFPSNKNNVKKYVYAKSSKDGNEISTQLEKWRDKREIVRVIFTTNDGKNLLNIQMVIESFERGLDKVSDIPYSIKLKQFIDLG